AAGLEAHGRPAEGRARGLGLDEMDLHVGPPQPELAQAQLEDVDARDMPRLLHDRVDPPRADIRLIRTADAKGYRGVQHHHARRPLLHREVRVARISDIAVDVVPTVVAKSLEDTRE